MLYFVLSDGQEIEWHVGEKKPVIFQPRVPNAKKREVTMIHADGHELDYLSLIPCLPATDGVGGPTMCFWKGSNARWIFNNWPEEQKQTTAFNMDDGVRSQHG